MNKSDIFWQTYLNLEKEAIEVSKFIFITDEVIKNVNGAVVTENCYTQLDTYSPHIADLLVRTCVQIEAISKELYFDNNGDKPRGDNGILFDEDCLKLVDKLWATHNKSVMVVAPFFNLTMDEHRILKPLKEAHRRHEYVGTKGHNTFVEAHLDTPNIRVIISDFNDIEFVPFDGQKL